MASLVAGDSHLSLDAPAAPPLGAPSAARPGPRRRIGFQTPGTVGDTNGELGGEPFGELEGVRAE